MAEFTGRRARIAPPPRIKRFFEVLKEAHLPDEHGRSQFYRPAGEGEEPTVVHLSAEDAKYWLMDGVIRPQETTEAPRERTQPAKRRRS